MQQPESIQRIALVLLGCGRCVGSIPLAPVSYSKVDDGRRTREMEPPGKLGRFIQRFGGALDLNVRLHILGFDGVHVRRPGGVRFVAVPSPTSCELQALVDRISKRVGRHLERRGLLIRDADIAYLDWDGEQASALDELAGQSTTYRVSVGPHQGQKAFTLQTLPPIAADDEPGELAAADRFSLHAGIAARANRVTSSSVCVDTWQDPGCVPR